MKRYCVLTVWLNGQYKPITYTVTLCYLLWFEIMYYYYVLFNFDKIWYDIGSILERIISYVHFKL
jgi:hypothetical protein